MNGKDVGMRREAVLSFAANVVVLAIEFAVIVLLARGLGADGVGTYFFILTLAVVLNRPTSAIAATVEKRASEVNTEVGRYFGLSLVVTAAYLLVILVIGMIFVRGFAEPYVTLTGPQYISFVTIVVSRSAYSLARKLYKAVGHPGAAMWVHTIRDGLFLPAVFIVVELGGGALEVVVARATILSVVAGVVFLKVGVSPTKPTLAVAKRTYEYARWHVPSGVTSTLLGRLPILLLGTFVGSSAVGIYQAAYRLTEFGPYIGTCVKSPLLVKLSGVTSGGLNPRPYLRTAMSYTPIVAAPVLSTALVAPDVVLQAVYGQEFTEAGVVFVVIAVGELLFAQSRTAKAALNGSDNPSYSFAANALALFVSIPASVIIIPQFGVLGGAILFLTSEFVIFTVVFVASYYTFGTAIFGDRFLVLVGIAAVGYGVVFKLLVFLLGINSLSSLAVVVVLSSVAYLGILSLSKEFRAGAIRTVKEIRNRARNAKL